MTITNYCSEISKREKPKFDHVSLKSSRGTHGVAENMTVHHRCQFLSLELYYNTEIGTVIDRNKDLKVDFEKSQQTTKIMKITKEAKS